MARSIKVVPKKLGRPATGRDPVSAIRLPAELTASIDQWAEKNAAGSRSEAIRRLVERGLAAQSVRTSKRTTALSSEMAGAQIDRMGDKSATDEQRVNRKRRLLKGPKEFRDMRGDQPKAPRPT